MKPYRPEILKFTSEDKKHHLSIPMPPKTPALSWDGKMYTWPLIANAHPKLVLFNEPGLQVILLGGLGDPGIQLGDVYIYSRQGVLLKYVDLKKEIPDLESMSREWTQLSNFPWLAALYLSGDGKNLSLWICRRLKASIDLQSFGVTIEPSNDVKLWDRGRAVQGKGLGRLVDIE